MTPEGHARPAFKTISLAITVIAGTILLFVVLVRTFGVNGTASSPATGVPDDSNGDILATVLSNDGGYDVATKSPTDSSSAVLASGNRDEYSAAWSPDRRQIAFVSDQADARNTDIYVMDADGSNVRRITTNPAIDSEPAWSPDGSSIAFSRNESDGHSDIFVVSLADGAETRLTKNDVVDGSPSWHPDGTTIAFFRNEGGNADIYTIRLDDLTEARLTTGDGAESAPDWSPDGWRIVYMLDENQDGFSDIFIMNADGSDPAPVASGASDERYPTWSADGHIAYVEIDASGTPWIEIVEPGGGSPTKVGSGLMIDW